MSPLQKRHALDLMKFWPFNKIANASYLMKYRSLWANNVKVYVMTIPILCQHFFGLFLTHPPYVSIDSTESLQNLPIF